MDEKENISKVYSTLMRGYRKLLISYFIFIEFIINGINLDLEDCPIDTFSMVYFLLEW